MPRPYSYDLRKKVIQAINLDGLKISEASQIFRLVETRLDYGFQGNERLGILKLCLINRLVMDIKLLTGKNLGNLSKQMGIKLK